MQLLERNRNLFKIKPESFDDLWVLSEIIQEGDLVFSKTKRKVKIGNDSSKQVTKLIFVKLLVEKVKFEGEILRVSGMIQNETEYTQIGQFHTLNFEINSIVEFEKNNFPLYLKKLLDRALDKKKGNYLLILIDKDDFIISRFNDFGYSIVSVNSGLGSKKRYNLDEDTVDSKLKLIGSEINKDYSAIVIAGPGFEKERLQKELKDKFGVKSILFNWFDVSSNSVQKVISNLTKSGILKENILSYEKDLVDELLLNISKNEKFAYGEEDVFEKIDLGQVEKLLVSTKFIENKMENGTFKDLNEKMILVENLNGEVFIINSKNEPGKILDGVSGIGGILRY
jgi:protein pelota